MCQIVVVEILKGSAQKTVDSRLHIESHRKKPHSSIADLFRTPFWDLQRMGCCDLYHYAPNIPEKFSHYVL